MSALKSFTHRMLCVRHPLVLAVSSKSFMALSSSRTVLTYTQMCLQRSFASQRAIPNCCSWFRSTAVQNVFHRHLPALRQRQTGIVSSVFYSSTPLIKGTGNFEQDKLVTQMNIRLVNESSFLSWCRNAYLSTVVGVAMITEGTTALAQGAGAGALAVGTMNLLWGTGCHIFNLVRLRHVSGMSGFLLFLNLLGSVTHCFLWAFVLICYVGFLDETNAFDKQPTVSSVSHESTSGSDLPKHNKVHDI